MYTVGTVAIVITGAGVAYYVSNSTVNAKSGDSTSSEEKKKAKKERRKAKKDQEVKKDTAQVAPGKDSSVNPDFG